MYMQGCSVGGGVEGGGVEGARAAASRAGRRRRGRQRRGRRRAWRQGQQWGDEGGGYMYEGGGATRVAATRPRAAATSAATWRRATPANLTRGVAKATPPGLRVRSNSKSCAPIQPRTAGRGEICAALRGGQAARPDNTAKVSAARALASLTNRLSSSQLPQPNQRPHR